MGAENSNLPACCGAGDPYHADINTNLQSQNTDSYRKLQKSNEEKKIAQLQKQLNEERGKAQEYIDKYENVQTESNEKYAELSKQYESECEQKSQLLTQLQVL